MLFTLTGISSTDGITVDGHVVTLTADNINGDDITIDSDIYTLALADDIDRAETTDAHFTAIADGSATYKSTGITEGFSISDDGKTVKYTEAVESIELFTLTGISSTDGIIVSEHSVVILHADNLDENTTVSIEGEGYNIGIGEWR